MNSICVFHNGNTRVLDYYKEKFSELNFVGNLACNPLIENSLYEISYADATLDVLLEARNHNVKIIRHISDYCNDCKNQMSECNIPDYQSWLENIVSRYLCVCDAVISNLSFEIKNNNKHVVITTGRTANTHYCLHLRKNYGIDAVENNKVIDSLLLESESATFLFREDHWQSAASTWIAKYNGFSHTYNGISTVSNFTKTPAIDKNWLCNNWLNICLSSFDHSVFYKHVLKKHMFDPETTENVIEKYQTASSKNSYKKDELIDRYHNTKHWYKNNLAGKIDYLYNNTKHLLNKEIQ